MSVQSASIKAVLAARVNEYREALSKAATSDDKNDIVVLNERYFAGAADVIKAVGGDESLVISIQRVIAAEGAHIRADYDLDQGLAETEQPQSV